MYGGEDFVMFCVVIDEVVKGIEVVINFVLLYNLVNIIGIKIFCELLLNVVFVVVFDIVFY